MDCANLPRCIALPVQHGLATLHEMQTVYGLEDCYDMLELMAVDNYNAHQWREFERKRP